MTDPKQPNPQINGHMLIPIMQPVIAAIVKRHMSIHNANTPYLSTISLNFSIFLLVTSQTEQHSEECGDEYSSGAEEGGIQVPPVSLLVNDEFLDYRDKCSDY